VALHQLGRAGLLHSNIFVAPFCPACRTDLFVSLRREGAHTGRAMAVIGIRPGPSRRLRARVSRKG
ncbi:MAG: laccase domain-containing protein, partial [Acidobacteria bacterium]|nr:laccase domain-containing protein [Acidobacteriota bacterium]